MFFARRSELPALSPEGVRGLRFSLNTPVVRTEDLPPAPARAAILLYESADAELLPLVGIRSLKSGEVVYFEPEGAVDDGGLDAAMAFGEGMGFLFDDDEIDQGDAERAFGMWTDLMVDTPAAAEAPLLPTEEPDASEVLLTEEVSLLPVDGGEPAAADSDDSVELPDLDFEEPASEEAAAAPAPAEPEVEPDGPAEPTDVAASASAADVAADDAASASASDEASSASASDEAAPGEGPRPDEAAPEAEELPDLVLPSDGEVDLPELILPEDRAAREAAAEELPDLSQPLQPSTTEAARLADAPSAPSLPPAVPLEIPGHEAAAAESAAGPSVSDLQPDITQPPVPPDTQQLTSMIEDALLGAAPATSAAPLPPATPVEIPEEPAELPLTKFRMESPEEEVTAAPDPEPATPEEPEPTPAAASEEPPKGRKERRRAALGRLRLVKKKRPLSDDDPRRQFLARILSAF